MALLSRRLSHARRTALCRLFLLAGKQSLEDSAGVARVVLTCGNACAVSDGIPDGAKRQAGNDRRQVKKMTGGVSGVHLIPSSINELVKVKERGRAVPDEIDAGARHDAACVRILAVDELRRCHAGLGRPAACRVERRTRKRHHRNDVLKGLTNEQLEHIEEIHVVVIVRIETSLKGSLNDARQN